MRGGGGVEQGRRERIVLRHPGTGATNRAGAWSCRTGTFRLGNFPDWWQERRTAHGLYKREREWRLGLVCLPCGMRSTWRRVSTLNL